MDNKALIDSLLSYIKELEKLITGIYDSEVYPVSFFSRTFDLAHKTLNDLHELEGSQVEAFRKQMEEHQALIRSIPRSPVKPHPAAPETIEPVQPAQPVQPSGNTEKHIVSLHEALEKQNLSDLKKAFSLNDRFYFRRELFNGDEAKMNKIISDLNIIHTYENSVAYLHEKLNWNMEDAIVGEFIKLLEKRFL
ncbi:MAG: hypothetical protein LBJ60_00290 [Tannerellaceae bacterium]|jgi:hypothetical protein|nr:hypothetical protein [Tannerellaceae bacterium]